MFLYNLVYEVQALHVINKNLERIFTDRFLQFLLLSWIFSAFLQGIAGFGVPVIVVTPILIALGFDPVISVASVLVGHSWSISFGSMGSSIYAINMLSLIHISSSFNPRRPSVRISVNRSLRIPCLNLSLIHI